MNHHRTSKNRKALQRLKDRPAQTPATPVLMSRADMDKAVFDVVLKTLYNNADVDILHLENDIYAPSKIVLPHKEAERLWEVMTSSGLISPVVGFGNSGKIELTSSGYQLMSQFGGYAEYLASQQNGNQPQTIILPIQVANDEETPEKKTAALPPANPKQDRAADHSVVRKSKYTGK